MKPSLHARRWALLLSLVVPASGCGGGSASIKGAVTLDGTPVESGHVNFVPIEGTPGAGARAQVVNGQYSVEAAARASPGVYRVEISARRKTGKKIPVGSPAPPGTMADEEVEAVPVRYNKSSTLREELKGGANTRDFSLTSKPEP